LLSVVIGPYNSGNSCKLLLERPALAAIARVTSVSQPWLQMYVNQKFYQTPKTIEVTQKNRTVDDST
jgi:hypothetical protein